MTVYQNVRDGVLHVTIDNAPVNALSQVERQGLIDAIERAEADGVSAVLIMGAGGSFIAGADVREFGKPPLLPHLPEVVDRIEACRVPVVALIEGQALGGGLEVALACHFRIAAPGAKLGLPEVTLGIVPGAGGTQRLPRLIDPVEAAKMISGGKPVSAHQALASGLIDEVTEGNLAAAGIALAKGEIRRSSRLATTATDAQLAELDKLEATTKKHSRGAEAPGEALKLVRLALTESFQEGVARERETFLRLRTGEQAAALRHIFFAERAAAKPPADAADAKARPIESVGVVGAGTMGTGIAMSVADAGLPVIVVEVSAEALARGLERIAKSYRSSAERGRISPQVAERRISLIGGVTDYASLAGCDLIVEAAFETMEVKRDVFARLNAVAKPQAILASNTSYLDLDEIAANSGRPHDVVGLHYFSPANVMKLLEVVRGRDTAADVLVSALAFAKRTGKVAVVAGVCNGFIGNRLMRAYNREAGLLLLEGATPSQVDGALTAFGMAMGPFAVADLSGIDIGYKARQAMPPGSFEPMAMIAYDRLVEAGELGQKTGSGFYVYEAGGKGKSANPAVAEILDRVRAEAGIQPREIGDEEIVERCMLALANEGGFILGEGIAARPGDIDVVYVNGYGFPRHRGGPMFYAEQRGEQYFRARIEKFAQGRFGKWWKSARPEALSSSGL